MNGYFWISYENDLKQICTIAEIDSRNTMGHNLYEYDEFGMTGTYGYLGRDTGAYINIYSKDSTKIEQLKAVSTYCITRGSFFNIFVANSGDPEDLMPVEISNAGDMTDKGYQVTEAGYVTFRLKEPVDLTGDKFIVGIEVYDENRNRNIPIEDKSTKWANGEFYCTNISAGAGQSYMYINMSDLQWFYSTKDLLAEDSYPINVCLKAFTNNVQAPTFTLGIDKEIKAVFAEADALTATKEDTININISNVDAVKINPEDFTFSSNASTYMQVNNMTVTNISGQSGAVDLTVKIAKSVIEDNVYLAYKGNIIDGTQAITVKRTADECAEPSITTQPVGQEVTKDEAVTLSVVASVTDGGTLSYQWYSNIANSITGGAAIAGATNSSYTVPTSEVGTLYYYVEVTNTQTGLIPKTTISNVIEVKVNQLVSQEPVSYQRITGFKPISMSLQIVDNGTSLAALNLPSSLMVTTTTSSIHITVEQWTSQPPYNSSQQGTYIFTPTCQIPQGYILDNGVVLPTIQVYVKEKPIYVPSRRTEEANTSRSSGNQSDSGNSSSSSASNNSTPSTDTNKSTVINDVIVSKSDINELIKGTITQNRESILIQSTLTNNASTKFVIPSVLFDSAKATSIKNVKLESILGTLEIPLRAINAGKDYIDVNIQPAKATDLSIAQQEVTKGKDVILLSIGSNNNEPSNTIFNEPVKLNIKYKLLPTENAKTLTMFKVMENGLLENVGGVYKDGHFISHLDSDGKFVIIDNKKDFIDVSPSNPAYNSISSLTSKGYLQGIEETKFGPEKELTRAEFAAILVRILKLSSRKTDIMYSDVSKNAWYANDIYAATEAGLINGIGENQFAPNRNITEQEMLVLIDRACEYMKISNNNLNGQGIRIPLTGVADYAKDAIERCINLGIANKNICPNQKVNRAEMAQAFDRFINLMYE